MLKKMFFIILFLVLAIHPILAKESAQIEINISQDQVMVGDDFQVSILLKNASTGSIRIGDLRIPGIENFQQVGTSQSTQVQMINGSTSAITKNILVLRAIKDGEYTLGPVEIKIANTSLKSNIVNLKVLKSSKSQLFSATSKSINGFNSITDSNSKKTKNNFKNIVINILALVLLVFMIVKLYQQKKKQKLSVIIDNKDNVMTNDLSPAIAIPNISDKDFFIKLKDNLLKFLHKKYDLNMTTNTTTEIIQKLDLKKIWQREEIKKVLQLCDQGNFAGQEDNKEKLIKIIKLLK